MLAVREVHHVYICYTCWCRAGGVESPTQGPSSPQPHRGTGAGARCRLQLQVLLLARPCAFQPATCELLAGAAVESDDVRTTVSVKTLTVSSVEELNTRSMSLSACPCDLLVTVGSHEQQSISRRAPPPGRHFWSRARMGLWSGVRVRFDTVSITVYRSLNAVTRGKSRLLPPAAHE